MGNPKGSRFEREVVDYLRERGLDAERLRLTGAKDEGDICLRLPNYRVIFEAKNQARMNLALWTAEAEVEVEHYCASRLLTREEVGFAVVHKRKQKGVGYAYVTMPLDEYLEQLV